MKYDQKQFLFIFFETEGLRGALLSSITRIISERLLERISPPQKIPNAVKDILFSSLKCINTEYKMKIDRLILKRSK